MNTHHQTQRPPLSGRALLRKTGALIALLAAVAISLLPAQSAMAAVTIDQQPLIIQKSLPPNIVLMLDDSGSMAWDYMPDWGYLTSTSGDAPNSSDINGVYYNPKVLYTPPATAAGGSYPSYSGTFPMAPEDGFNPSTPSNYTDITQYSSPTENFHYYATLASGGASCPSGTNQSGVYPDYCYWPTQGSYDPSNPNYAFHASNDYYYYAKVCTLSDPTACATGPVFKYAVTTSSGLVTHYVSPSGCGTETNCVKATDITGVAAPAGVAAGTNVANWFAYYHTRILMAKSGLMSAFSTLDPTFRFGFGSINGRNTADIPSPYYSFSTSTKSSNRLANVTPFGDGASGTRKDQFWTWLVGESPSNSTPLRGALNGVGSYYKTAQPWQTSSSDTTELACRQSYTIMTTDGFWNGDSPNVGNVDGTKGSTITDPNGLTYTYNAAAPYSDGNSNTLADVAMKYWSTDLRTSVPNEVPTSTEDPAFWQHMVTFTIGLGFTPTGISPAGTTIDQIFSWANGGTAISGFSWPTPSSNNIKNIADLAHAAVDGHGGFYSATSPQAFANGLQDALKRATARVGSGASLAANSTQLATGTVTYQSIYHTGKWTGDLQAFAVDSNTGAISATSTWSAGANLSGLTATTAAARNIYTYNPTLTPAKKRYVAFTAAKLSSAEVTALGGSTNAPTMVNYLRGDPSYESKNNGSYRNRDIALGDIINSQPVYEGAPDPNRFNGQTFTGSSTYATFATNELSRSPTVFVAANDGMLHAFDAGTGNETFAYVPGAVITNGLSTLSNPDYGAVASVPHQFFNDGELTIADAYYSSNWHTVLVGTTGRGPAKAIYAFDVTDPTNIQFLWERSSGDGLTNSGYIGQMTGKPVVAQTADGTWSVLMGNGYNSTNGSAALLQFDIQTGALTAYTTDASTSNGLAAPAVWLADPTNGLSTTAYAGDLLGRVWSFDLTTTNAGHTGTKLFTATDGTTAQPITSGLLAGKDPATGNVWVFFGTGEYLNSGDLTNLQTQSWYGLIVQSATTSLVSNLLNGRASALVQRSIVAEVAPNPSATPPTLGARAFTPLPTPNGMAGKSGWYIDLTSPLNGAEGERMVTPNQFQGSLLIGTSRIPQATDVCNPTGRGWILALDPFTGTNPPAVFFDINGDGKFDASDMIAATVDGKTVYLPAGGVGFSSLPNNPIFVGNTMLVSFDNGKTSNLNTAGSVGGLSRVSWREIVNQ